MALLDDLEQFVKNNTTEGSWMKQNLRERCGDFIEEEGITAPTGRISITENGTVDVAQYASADVEVSGGSSRFSFAQITIVANDNEQSIGEVTLTGVNPNAAGYAFWTEYGGYGALLSVASVGAGETSTATVLLIDGGAEFDVDGENAVVTGNAEYDSGIVIITGDCTLTADPVIPK